MHRLGQLPLDFADGLRADAAPRRGCKKELIDIERDYIYELLRDGKITDEARRRIEYELDLEEASLAQPRARLSGGWLLSYSAARCAPARSGARCSRSPSA